MMPATGGGAGPRRCGDSLAIRMETMLVAVGLGAAIGVVIAITGAGGGVLSVPLLVFVLHLPLQQAAPLGLAAVGLASGVGAALGLHERVLRYRAAGFVGVVGMAAAPLGVALAQVLPNRPLVGLFSLVLGFVGWRMLRPASALRPEPVCRLDPADGRLSWTAPCARVLAGTGVASGFLSGLLGVGGGFVIIPSLLRHTDLALHSVQATSLGVVALVSLSGTAAAAWHGSLRLPLLWPFAGGAVAALLLVRPLAKRLPSARLQQLFGLLCAGVALSMAARAAGWM